MRPRPALAILMLLALLAAACLPGGRSTTSSPPPTFAPLTTTSPTLPEVSVNVQDCTTPPVAFGVLCQVVDLVLGHHVAAPKPAALAAAAMAGIQTLEDEGSEVAPPSTLTCAIPDPAFEPICDAIAERIRFEGIAVEDLVVAAVESMITFSLDPHTVYLGPEFVDAITADGVVASLGILITAEDAAGSPCRQVGGPCPLKVVSVLPESTAGLAGLFPGDLVTAIDGHDVEGLTLIEAAIALDGETGTPARVDIIRDGGSFSLSIDRQNVDYDTVNSEIIQPGVGYLRLLQFGPDSPYEFHYQLQALLDGGANTIVLDLRDNPGGLLTSVVIIGSEFLTGGLVLKTAGAEEALDYPVLEGGIATGDVRVVVLINRGSASAAEVLAAVLQERGRAVVVGEPSYGKNTVQEPFDLRNRGILRVTVARWTTPSGASVELRGVLPDIAVSLSTALNVGEVVDTALAATG